MANKLACLAVLLLVNFAFVLGKHTLDDWSTFKHKHGKRYNSTAHEAKRQANFEARKAAIDKHNEEADAGAHSFTQGLNEYSDLTHEELGVMNGYKHCNDSHDANRIVFEESRQSVPTSVDWRAKGYVTPVKNQGQCGSCYSFSATGALEGQRFKNTGQLVSLSEQQIVDCNTLDTTMFKGSNPPAGGCNGGYSGNSFAYAAGRGGLDTEACYPYKAVKGTCSVNAGCLATTDSANIGYVQSNSETALMQAIANIGPISVSIQVSGNNFYNYRSGVFYDPSCTNSPNDLNHAVLAVGYGTDPAGGNYWLVKNSWGTSWGEAGYIRMARPSNKGNSCGILLQSLYPTGVVMAG